MSLPLVSCIMPTKGRPAFAAKAIEYFERQSYPNKELVIVQDEDSFLIRPAVDRYRLALVPSMTLGAKRNFCVEHSRGDLIAHWDDDDWYGPERLMRQVAAMQAGAAICGTPIPLFYDLRDGRAWRYWWSPVGKDAKCYVYSATMMYTREFWRQRPFEDVQVGAGNGFLAGRDPRHCAIVPDDWYVGIAHSKNNSPKVFKGPYFWRVEAAQALKQMGDDAAFYTQRRAA